MIHENQTDWQRQLNFDVGQNSHKSQSNHILGTSSNDTNEQHQLQDIFGRSTKRPISAPPTSDEVSELFTSSTNFRVLGSPYKFDFLHCQKNLPMQGTKHK